MTEPTPTPASTEDVLTEILRKGAQRLLAYALETEVESYPAVHAEARDEAGRRRG